MLVQQISVDNLATLGIVGGQTRLHCVNRESEPPKACVWMSTVREWVQRDEVFHFQHKCFTVVTLSILIGQSL